LETKDYNWNKGKSSGVIRKEEGWRRWQCSIESKIDNLGGLGMGKGMIYARVYRGEGIACVGKTTINATLKKLKMVRDSYLEGINVQVLERQTGLTEKEIKSFVGNYKREMERINKYRKHCLKDSEVPDVYILNELRSNEIKVVRRLFDGEVMGNITRDMGIPYRESVCQKFKAEMREKGYIIHDIQQHYRIAKDINLGVQIDEMVEKYRMFVNERDVLRYLDLHQLLYY